MAQELATKIQSSIITSLLPAAKGDAVGPVLRNIAFALEAAQHLVQRSCEEKWWNEIFWRGDSTEAFSDVLLNLQAASDIAIIAIGNRSCIDRSISRTRSRFELGEEWNSMVLQDHSFLECNVRLVIQREDDPASRMLEAMDLEIAKDVQAKLDGTGTCNVIQFGISEIMLIVPNAQGPHS